MFKKMSVEFSSFGLFLNLKFGLMFKKTFLHCRMSMADRGESEDFRDWGKHFPNYNHWNSLNVILLVYFIKYCNALFTLNYRFSTIL